MSGEDSDIGVKEGRTVVRIAGEGEEQTPPEDLEVPLDHFFGPGIRQEHLHKTCRMSQTSAHPSLFSRPLFLSLFGRAFSSGTPARDAESNSLGGLNVKEEGSVRHSTARARRVFLYMKQSQAMEL
jgi:hypothetical protein